MTRTAFLDRDGTINREQGFVTAPDQLVILPGVVAALRRLAAADCRIVVRGATKVLQSELLPTREP